MLLLKHLHLLLIHIPHLLRRHRDLVPVLVVAVRGDRVHGLDRRARVVDHAEGGEVGGGDRLVGVVIEAFVALEIIRKRMEGRVCVGLVYG